VRILYLAMKYDYGDPARGLGFEHYNFYDSLHNMGHELIYFDFMTLYQRLGKQAMNRRLLDVARSEKPDVCFSVLFTDQFEPDAISKLSETCPTVNWFCDDHWRFESYSKYWAPRFTWVVTTARSAPPKYEAMGCHQVIKSQWACNHFLYRKLDLPLSHDVTFVGQPHGNRRAILDALRAAGLGVKVWGMGWTEGRLSQDEMIRVFNQSRINLNLSNASVLKAATIPSPAHRIRRRLFGDAHTGDRERHPPAVTDPNDQIKGRNFEVPGCGGFMLTGTADDLTNCYELDQEIVVFESFEDLVGKIRYYLAHEAERATIAETGYKRTLAEHTYVHRFTDVFERMGFRAPAPEALLAAPVSPGNTVEVS
jgi:spore maturation protein CgeB